MLDQPQMTSPVQQQSESMAMTSLILGIIALVICLAAVISIPVGIAAIVTGMLAMRRQVGKGMAMAGIITGALGVIIGVISVLMIFIALPALQRGQRDAAVKNDVSLASSAVYSYRTNNEGRLPSVEEFSSAEFKQKYMPDISSDVTYEPGVDCRGQDSGPVGFSVTAQLEAGGSTCLE